MIRWMGWAVGTMLFTAGCNGNNCPADKQIEAWIDNDGDGFGGEVAQGICDLEDGYAGIGGDCDDTDPKIYPEASERCNGRDDDCNGTLDDGHPLSSYFPDNDRDNFGDPAGEISACAPPDEFWSSVEGDCNDDDNLVNPEATEICNGGIDDDCDGNADDDDDVVEGLIVWHMDADEDGFGRAGPPTIEACAAPPGAVADESDCNDTDPNVNPAAQEICNGGIDDDCDDMRDDLDDSLDTSGQSEWNADADGDTFGDPNVFVMACGPVPGIAANDGDDCDDTNLYVNPAAGETPCDVIDNDCNPETPDDGDRDEDGYFMCADNDCRDLDPTIHPGAIEIPGDSTDQDCDGYEDCFEDLDGDGSRTDTPVAAADPDCLSTGYYVPPSYPIDCDDSDPNITWSGRWRTDGDGDGFGEDTIALVDCNDPGAGYVLEESGDPDCDDNAPAIYPGAPDACNDGIDADCDTIDTCASCLTWHQSDPALLSGVYPIRPSGDAEIDIYCDMETDEGGWTLVASTALGTLNDQGSAYYADLTTLTPVDPHAGIWNGMSNVIDGANADVRFACKTLLDDLGFTVDLSFYDVPWYSEFVSGSDASVCFTEGANPDATPARRNNLLNLFLDTTDPYSSGALVGEDVCTDTDDFTVDFTDAGMDGNTSDGTDWGEDDGKQKCAVANAGEAWFIFVRELPPSDL